MNCIYITKLKIMEKTIASTKKDDVIYELIEITKQATIQLDEKALNLYNLQFPIRCIRFLNYDEDEKLQLYFNGIKVMESSVVDGCHTFNFAKKEHPDNNDILNVLRDAAIGTCAIHMSSDKKADCVDFNRIDNCYVKSSKLYDEKKNRYLLNEYTLEIEKLVLNSEGNSYKKDIINLFPNRSYPLNLNSPTSEISIVDPRGVVKCIKGSLYFQSFCYLNFKDGKIYFNECSNEDYTKLKMIADESIIIQKLRTFFPAEVVQSVTDVSLNMSRLDKVLLVLDEEIEVCDCRIKRDLRITYKEYNIRQRIENTNTSSLMFAT